MAFGEAILTGTATPALAVGKRDDKLSLLGRLFLLCGSLKIGQTPGGFRADTRLNAGVPNTAFVGAGEVGVGELGRIQSVFFQEEPRMDGCFAPEFLASTGAGIDMQRIHLKTTVHLRTHSQAANRRIS